MDANERMKKKFDENNTRMLRAFLLIKSWEQHAYKTAAVRSLASHLTNYSSKMSKTCWPLLEK